VDEPSTDVISGTLDMLILKTLSLAPMHGFGIARRVEQMSRGFGRQIDASRVVAIEDSRTGLRSARAAGLRTLGLATSYPANTLIEAEHVLADISQVTLERLEALAASDWVDADASEVR